MPCTSNEDALAFVQAMEDSASNAALLRRFSLSPKFTFEKSSANEVFAACGEVIGEYTLIAADSGCPRQKTYIWTLDELFLLSKTVLVLANECELA